MDKVKAIGGNIGKSLFYGGSGGIGSLLAGGWAGANAKDHQLKAVMEARNKHLANTMAGNTALYRGRKAASNLLLGADDGAAMKKKISSYSSAFNAYKDFKTTAEDKMADSSSFRRSVSFKVGNGPNDDRNMADVNFKQIVRNLELAKNGDTTAANWFTNFGTTAEEVDLHLNDIKDQFTSAYMAEAYAGGADATTRGKMEYALDAAGDMEYNLDLSSVDGALGSVKGAMGDASDKEREIKTSDAYKRLSGQ